MKFIKKNIKVIGFILFLILVFCLVGLKIYLNNKVEEDIESNNLNDILVNEDEEVVDVKEEKIPITNVYVDIKGAVVSPGVYEIESDKKIMDVVNKAGGLTESADTSMINLAKQVTNEMVIIIYTKDEVEKYSNKEEIIKIIEKECVCPKVENNGCFNNNESDSVIEENKDSILQGSESDNNNSQKISLNTASLEELQTLTGIGESKAKAIIEYRNEHGSFNSIEEIKQVSGIGDALYEKIKENITV